VQAQAQVQASLESTPAKKTGLGSKIVKSLSFSRRKKPPAKPAMPDDLSPEDLISARGNNPEPAMLLGQPLESPAATPTGGGQPKKRSLSFTRRKKSTEAPKQSV